jgi:hypothetical protein
MAGILIFLGAGASRPFGIPTMKEMVVRFEEKLYQDNLVSEEERELYQAIRKNVTDQSGVADLETVFSVIEGLTKGPPKSELSHYARYCYYGVLMKEMNDLEPKLVHELKSNSAFAGSLKNRFERFILEECRLRGDQRGHLIQVYGELFKQLSERAGFRGIGGTGIQYGDVSICTTNYDLCVELFCRMAGISLANGFEEDKIQHGRLPKWETLDGSGPRLIKLHGSISWRVRDDGQLIEHEAVGDETLSGEKLVGRAVLYPIDQKAVYRDPYFQLYYRFKRDLQAINRWVVIGYSFNDDVIAQTFSEAATSSKRLVVVHPHLESIWSEKLSQIRSRGVEPKGIHAKFGGEGVNNDICRLLFGG